MRQNLVVDMQPTGNMTQFLVELDFYDNRIEEIKGLEHLSKLK